MARIGLPKGSGKRLKVREKSVKSQGILKWILSGNPVNINHSGKFYILLEDSSNFQKPLKASIGMEKKIPDNSGPFWKVP